MRGSTGLSASEDGSVQGDERGGVVCAVVAGALNEVLGMFGDPGMIGCDVIGYEVEEETQAAVRELLACYSKAVRTAQMSST